MIYPKLSDGTIDWCAMCKHEGRAIFDGCCECEYPENSDDPPTKYEPKPMTNGDRIRTMTDEELAKLFWIRADCRLCPNKAEHCLEDCRGAWLKWLKQDWLQKEASE